MLRKKATKAPSTDDHLSVRADKVLADAFDIIHNLLERVRSGLGTLAVGPEIKGQHA